MCIIVAKEKNCKIPKKQILKNCFDYNSDGAGFMYVNNDNQVVIDKGYMTFNDFYKRLKKLKKEYNDFKGKCLVMHFRIGTSGGNVAENTHPYVISKKIKDLKKLYTTCDIGVVHNGIISHYTPKKGTTNDTQRFIMNYLYKIYKYIPDFYKDADIMYGIERTCQSKLCFLNNKDELYYVGDFIEDNGIMYSNDTYEPYYNYTPIYDDYMKLDSDWIVIDSDKNEYRVGNKKLYINCYGELYEKNNSRYSLIDVYVNVFNKNGELIF